VDGGIGDVEFGHLLRTFDRIAFRLELQPVYLEDSEQATVAAFVAGHPQPPTEVPYLQAWFDQVGDLTRAGKTINRVRVHDDPPTPYQRWERWIGRWNIEAGETIRYLTRAEAHDIGLLPAAGATDWWLLDDTRLLAMTFNGEGHRIRTQLVTDPTTITQACAWRDLAVRHSVPEVPGRAAA